jgi:site-specific recombinase XerD
MFQVDLRDTGKIVIGQAVLGSARTSIVWMSKSYLCWSETTQGEEDQNVCVSEVSTAEFEQNNVNGAKLNEVPLSTDTQLVLRLHIRDSTRKVYESCWNNWSNFCKRNNISAMQPPVNVVCNYLTELKQSRGLSFTTLVGYKSAIMKLGKTNFNNLDLQTLNCLFKGFKNMSPPKQRYAKTWNLDKVLTFVEGLGENRSLSFLDLSQKLVFLLASIGVSRISELAALSFQPQQKLSNAWILRRTKWKKNTSVTSGAKPCLVVPAFEDNHMLCPVRCLEHYLAVTAAWRSEQQQQLFLSMVVPHQTVSKNTLARWLKRLMGRAGIDTSIYKAHSIRSATAAKAISKGISIDQIMAAADWSSKHNFAKFYKREIDLDITSSVLQK